MMPAWLQVINLASNNYLGLATHPKLRAAAAWLAGALWLGGSATCSKD